MKNVYRESPIKPAIDVTPLGGPAALDGPSIKGATPPVNDPP